MTSTTFLDVTQIGVVGGGGPKAHFMVLWGGFQSKSVGAFSPYMALYPLKSILHPLRELQGTRWRKLDAEGEKTSCFLCAGGS